MIKEKTTLGLFVLLVAIVTTQCANENNPAEVIDTATKISDNTTPEISINAIETSTIAKTNTPLVTPLESQTPFSSEDSYAILLEMLRTNGGCTFPCLWGVRQDKDSRLEILKTLDPILNISSFFSETEDSIRTGFEFLRNDVTIYINQTYYLDIVKGTGQYVQLTTQALRVVSDGFERLFDSEEYSDVVHYYSMQGILSTYGLPSQIVIGVENNIAEADSPDFFNFWFVYREDSFIAHFYGEAEIGNASISFCPTQSFGDIWLFDPGENVEFNRILEEKTGRWEGNSPTLSDYQLLQSAIGLENQQFVETFTNFPETCVSTPLDMWSD